MWARVVGEYFERLGVGVTAKAKASVKPDVSTSKFTDQEKGNNEKKSSAAASLRQWHRRCNGASDAGSDKGDDHEGGGDEKEGGRRELRGPVESQICRMSTVPTSYLRQSYVPKARQIGAKNRMCASETDNEPRARTSQRSPAACSVVPSLRSCELLRIVPRVCLRWGCWVSKGRAQNGSSLKAYRAHPV